MQKSEESQQYLLSSITLYRQVGQESECVRDAQSDHRLLIILEAYLLYKSKLSF